MANTKIDRIKLNGSDTVYDIDLPPDATPSISSLTIANGLTGAGVFTWSKTAYGETGTTQIADGCRLLFTQGYSSPSIEFSTHNTTTPYLSSITTTSISFANDSIYPSILWHSNIPNMSGKPFFLTSDLLGKRNYIAQLDNTGKILAAQLPSNYLDKGDRDSATNQIIYNPVEMKKALTVPSIQTTPIQYSPTDYGSAVSLGYTTINGITKAQIQLACPGLGYTYITQTDNEFAISATTKLSCNNNGGWTIAGSKIITEATLGSAVGSISTESILSICI